jgi:Protein of unknown function (DUF2420)
MADDSMEISSQHGHSDGDGDIDIDFDFTSAPVDEDYVLEDAALPADVGEDLRPQPSPAIGNDDLMIDEDVDSYPMDDADLLHGEEGQIQHEALPFDNESPFHLEEDPNHGLHFEGDDLNSGAAYMYGHQESSEAQVVENDASEGNLLDAPQGEDLQAAEVVSVPDVEKPSADAAQHESRRASLLYESPKSAVSAPAPKSPPAPNLERGPTSPTHTSEYHETNVTSPSLSGDGGKAVEATSLDTTTLRISPQDVMVVYQSVEYALFSSSELDDPDSFFLSDTSIADKPLADLFKAIRQVIQEDLSEEDELCMAVEDLGIETEEVSCAQVVPWHSRLTPMQQSAALLHDVTLTQILNLREKLLRNDGVESSGPLCIILGTRTNFSKRIEKLTIGVAEGKGLSQFVTWDEHSESIDELEDANDNEIGVEPTSNSQELQNISCGQDADAHQPAQGVENGAAEEPAQGHECEPEAADDAKPASTDSVSGDSSVQQSSATDANLSSLQNANENGNASNEYFDEDDLIDYSEEEGDRVPEVQRHAKSHSNHEDRTNQGIFNLFPPCLKPNTCFCSKCSVLLLAEYEAINEDLRRRSLSRTNEDKVPEQSNEQASPATEGDHEGAYVEESGIEYEEKNEHQEGFQNAHLNTGYEDFTTGDFDAPDSLGQFDGAGLTIDEFGEEGEFANDGAFGDSFDVFGTEAQEYNYGDEGTFEDDGDRHQIQQNQADVPGTEVKGNKPEQVDTAESSVTVDADEIQYEDEDEANGHVPDNSITTAESHETEHSIGVEHEIDYEDENEVDKGKESGATTPLAAPRIIPSSSGKRSRGDVESDDAMIMRGKGTYWAVNLKRRRS